MTLYYDNSHADTAIIKLTGLCLQFIYCFSIATAGCEAVISGPLNNEANVLWNQWLTHFGNEGHSPSSSQVSDNLLESTGNLQTSNDSHHNQPGAIQSCIL